VNLPSKKSTRSCIAREPYPIPTYSGLVAIRTIRELASSSLLDDNVHVRDIRSMPPLFGKLTERRPDVEGTDHDARVLSSEFIRGLTQIHRDERTAFPELVKGDAWLSAYARDFHKRFLSLMSYQFGQFPSVLSLSI
jgi:N-acetyltransferase 10